MDVVTFVEEYLGIELLTYQKEYLKWLSNQDTKHTYWLTCTPKTGEYNTEDNGLDCMDKLRDWCEEEN